MNFRDELQAPYPKTTYVLGAGFSRAVSAHMPITDELGGRAVDQSETLGATLTPRFSGSGITFENWMTWLAERQPYQSEAQHFQDQAVFAELTQVLADILRSSQANALNAGVPRWLAEFVDVLHQGRSDVITLNYDTIIESTLDSLLCFDAEGRVMSNAVVSGFPNGQAVMFSDGRPRYEERDTFTLHKLHGSLDWYAVPGDRTGSTLDRIPEQDQRLIEAAIGGRETFLVPPTSTKSGYFDNPKTRFIWQRAKNALAVASRVVLVGYSLPLTDSAISKMLWSTLFLGTQEIVVVNPDARSVRARLTALGVEDERITEIAGADCVADMVSSEIATASARLARDLAGLDGSRPVAVGASAYAAAAVLDSRFDVGTGTLTLILDSLSQPLSTVLHPAAVSNDSQVRTTKTLGELFRDHIPARIVARLGDQEWTVVARRARVPEMEASWVLLMPSGLIAVH